MSVSEYIQSVNDWLAVHTNIIPVRLCVGEFTETSTENKRASFEFTLVYEEVDVKQRYGFYSFSKESGLKIGLDIMKDYWQQVNPTAQIVLCSFMHGITEDVPSEEVIGGNCNRLWILYKSDRAVDCSQSIDIPSEYESSDKIQLFSDTDQVTSQEIPEELTDTMESISADETEVITVAESVVEAEAITEEESFPETALSEGTEEAMQTPDEAFEEVAVQSPAYKFCHMCGKRCELEDVFCFSCGTKLL